jgi:hypothetical protein
MNTPPDEGYEQIISFLLKRPIAGGTHKNLEEFVSEHAIQTITSGFVLYLIKQIPNEQRKVFIEVAMKIIKQTIISNYDSSVKEIKNKKGFHAWCGSPNDKEEFILKVNKVLVETKKQMEIIFLNNR